MSEQTVTTDTKEEGEMKLPTRKTYLDEPAALAAAKAEIARATGLQIDGSKLEAGERRRVVELTQKLCDGPGWNLERLTKRERKTWERVVGKGIGNESYFEQERDLEKVRQKAQEALAVSMRRPPRPVLEAAGGLYFPADMLQLLEAQQEHQRKFVFQLADFAVLTFVCYLLENPERASRLLPPGASLREEGGELVLSVDPRFGLIPQALDHRDRLDWRGSLERLEMTTFLRVERGGNPWEIRIGNLGRFVTERSVAAKAKQRKAVAA